MRELPLSNNEKKFAIQAIKQNQRLDGRKNDEFRKINIVYGAEYGGVMVTLGETRVLAQISGEVGEPKATRSNEGVLYINVELGPMAAPHYEIGRQQELTVQIIRTLERTFIESHCVDMESLCIIAEEIVWVLRVQLNILNHEGNLIDCCSVATLCALAHFRRPDVSIIKNEVIIHKATEREPLATVMHHYPVCISYVTFDDGHLAVADPTVIEERISDSQMIFGINSFRELCCLNLGGSSLTTSSLLLQCSQKAAEQALHTVNLVKKSLAEDAAAREANHLVGFAQCLRPYITPSLIESRLVLKLRNFTFQDIDNTMQQDDIIQDNPESFLLTSDPKLSNPNTSSEDKWLPLEEDLEKHKFTNTVQSNKVEEEPKKKNGQSIEKLSLKNRNLNNSTKNSMIQTNIILASISSDSEEDVQIIL